MTASSLITPSEVIGSYEAHQEEKVFNLNLKKDQTFTHFFRSKEGKGFNSQGTWIIETHQDSFLPSYETRLILKGALSLGDDFQNKTTVFKNTVIDTWIENVGDDSIIIINNPDDSSKNYYRI